MSIQLVTTSVRAPYRPRRDHALNVQQLTANGALQPTQNFGLELEALLERAAIELVPVTSEQMKVARRAWRQFGKGKHPAA